MIRAKNSGNFHNFMNFARRIKERTIFDNLNSYGRRGVDALAAATAVDSGVSADSWSYRIFMRGKNVSIEWFNYNVDSSGTPIVILLQYGHATGTGGYVAGQDFINPAMRPIFDEIQADVWKAVRR